MAYAMGAALSFQPAQKIAVDAPVTPLALNAEGTRLLCTGTDLATLSMLDLTQGTKTVIDNGEAAGRSAMFANDGKTVIYKTVRRVDGLMTDQVSKYDLATGRAAVAATPSRKAARLQTVDGNVNYVASNYKTITVQVDGKSTEISPIADAHSYLYASLSPDGQKILFKEAFKGIFTCNLDGTGLRQVAKRGTNPQWCGNDDVVYMVTADDGYVITAAKLVAQNLSNGELTQLTDDVTIVDAAKVAPARIVYTDANGSLFSITVTK